MKTFSIFISILLPSLASANPSPIPTPAKAASVTPVTESPAKAIEAIPGQTEKGTLSDRRDYIANLSFTSAGPGRKALGALDLKIGDVPVSVPGKAWSDLQMPMPMSSQSPSQAGSNAKAEEKSGGVTITDFDGEIRVMLESYLGEKGGVAILTVKKNETWVSSREFVWFESPATPGAEPAKRSEIQQFPPHQVPMEDAALPVLSGELKIHAVEK